MITIIDVLESLKVKNWTLRGNGLTETEFNKGFTQNRSKNPNEWSITWSEVSEKFAELEAAEPMRLLKEERNRRLAETDWRFRIDQEPKQEWYEYCQALRDLPSNSDPQLDENGQLTNVNWPEVPNA